MPGSAKDRLIRATAWHAAARALLFWPWTAPVQGPRDFLGALLRGGGGAALAGVRGLADGARGGPPRRFREELGLEARP